mgnify:CR=1 FL=1
MQLIAVAVTIAAIIGVAGAWAVSSLDPNRRGGRIIARLFLGSIIVAVVMPMILLGAIGFFLYGPHLLMGATIAMDLGSRKASATASGVIDCLGYMGAAVASLEELTHSWCGVSETRFRNPPTPCDRVKGVPGFPMSHPSDTPRIPFRGHAPLSACGRFTHRCCVSCTMHKPERTLDTRH